MDKKPKISVIMPVYNAERYLRDAIDSILNQTFVDFEFLIFNDGSTDQSKQIIESYADHRIRFFDSPINKGYVEHLNRGIDLAQGEYIARMDADDISMPERFAMEAAYLDKHPRTGLVGSYIAVIDRDGRFKNNTWRFSAPNSEIPTLLLFTNYFAHPSVMYRSSLAKKIKYEASHAPSEDFKMWTDMADVSDVACIKKYLLLYREHDKNVGWSMSAKCRVEVMRILAEQIRKLGVAVAPDEEEFHNSLSFDQIDATDAMLARANDWYEKIYAANNAVRKYPKTSLLYALLGRWAIWSKKRDGALWFVKRTFWSSKIIRRERFNASLFASFSIKVLWLMLQKAFIRASDNMEYRSIIKRIPQ